MLTVSQLIELLSRCDPAALVVMTAHNASRDVVRIEEVQPGLYLPARSWAGGKFLACPRADRNAVCLWPPHPSRRFLQLAGENA